MTPEQARTPRVRWWRRFVPARTRIPCDHPAVGGHDWFPIIEPMSYTAKCARCGEDDMMLMVGRG